MRSGRSAGIAHFGFRLIDPGDIDEAVAAIQQAGGTVLSRGELVPGASRTFRAEGAAGLGPSI
jgi:hypothetical protein